MTEYICRETALKKLKMQLLDLEADQDKGEYSELCENRGARDALEGAIYDIRTLKPADVQPVNQWISCKDKMPEDNTMVLFVYVAENGIKSVHYGYHQTVKGLGSSWAKPSGGWQYCDDDVTYWQPLPEPPKEGDVECQ